MGGLGRLKRRQGVHIGLRRVRRNIDMVIMVVWEVETEVRKRAHRGEV